MQNILVLGAGKIGSLISFLLAHSQSYSVYLADIHTDAPAVTLNLPHFTYAVLDANDANHISSFIKKNKINAIVSSLPYYCDVAIAKIALEHGLPYFDLTEDVETTHAVENMAIQKNIAFVPQCGLAPGFISIVANHLMQHFETLDTVKMRVGALPANISNVLQYSLTWSTDGLINEYGNPCPAIENGELVNLQPLEGLEEINIDGLAYEAFNTSGGIGSLSQTYQKKIRELNYKTIRYPGHCAKIKFLMNDLKLNEDRETLKRIFERALPKTLQDVVLVYVSVTGMKNQQFIEENYVKKFYPKFIHDHHWSAIQLTTASGICSVVDRVLSHPEKYQGLVRQEQFSLDDITHNRFGKYFAEE